MGTRGVIAFGTAESWKGYLMPRDASPYSVLPALVDYFARGVNSGLRARLEARVSTGLQLPFSSESIVTSESTGEPFEWLYVIADDESRVDVFRLGAGERQEHVDRVLLNTAPARGRHVSGELWQRAPGPGEYWVRPCIGALEHLRRTPGDLELLKLGVMRALRGIMQPRNDERTSKVWWISGHQHFTLEMPDGTVLQVPEAAVASGQSIVLESDEGSLRVVDGTTWFRLLNQTDLGIAEKFASLICDANWDVCASSSRVGAFRVRLGSNDLLTVEVSGLPKPLGKTKTGLPIRHLWSYSVLAFVAGAW